MDTLILDAIVKYNEMSAKGANMIELERKFPEIDSKEINTILERLVQEGEIVRQNYLYYPKSS
ncbi:hypothetical protein KKA03_03560 [archaeon]|nr:hypothetical protein [archaeon]